MTVKQIAGVFIIFPAVICSKYHLPLYPSYFKLQGRWLHLLTPVTYFM